MSTCEAGRSLTGEVCPSSRVFHLRQIRSIRRSLPRHALLTLIRALVVSRVDYCISVLAGISGHLLDRLQTVLNAAARLVYGAGRTDHITPLLRELHWLKVRERIQFRLCVLTHRCLNGTAPSYLADSLHHHGGRWTTMSTVR